MSKENPSTSRDSSRAENALWAELPEDLAEKIEDVTGPIQLKARELRSGPWINWQQYLERGMISQADFNFLMAYQRATTKEERDQLLEYFKSVAMRTLVKVVQHICVVEEIQRFLVRFDDMLWEDMTRIDLFFPDETHPWKAFLDLLTCGDEFSRNISSRIITKFIMRMRTKPTDSDMEFYLDWLKNQLKQDNKYLLSLARCLQKLLRIDVYRMSFLSCNGIFRIVRLLCSGIRPQAQYLLVFCIWTSSFNEEVAERLNSYSIIPVLMELLESCPAEIIKLPRVILATLRNLLVKPRVEGAKKHNAHVMIQCKIMKWLQIIRSRLKIITDPEFIEDFEAIEEILKNYISDLSTFDEYKLEVKSGRLEWSVVHKSKQFWNQNAVRLNEDDHELLRELLSLLKESEESTVLCVAAYDLGQYMSHFPWGKKKVEELGGKDALLKRLSDQNSAVKYHSLKTLQILMLNNYDLLVHYVSDSSSLDAVKRQRDSEKDSGGRSEE